MALAPKPKVEAGAAEELSLVSITLTDAGRAALGCDVATVQAISIGGTADAPVVLTLPANGCASTIIKFPGVAKTELGDVTKIEPLNSKPEPMPSVTPVALTPTSRPSP